MKNHFAILAEPWNGGGSGWWGQQ